MALKSIATWATEVSNYGFDKICDDNTLKNAVSRALAKAHSKDQFDFLNDKGTPLKKYEVYIAKANDLNIENALVKKCTAAKDNPKDLKKLIDGEVTREAKTLFDRNLKDPLKASPDFATWVGMQNKPVIEAQAKKIAKIMAIENIKLLTEAITAVVSGEAANAKKLVASLETAEKKKDIYAPLLKLMKANGLV